MRFPLLSSRLKNNEYSNYYFKCGGYCCITLVWLISSYEKIVAVIVKIYFFINVHPLFKLIKCSRSSFVAQYTEKHIKQQMRHDLKVHLCKRYQKGSLSIWLWCFPLQYCLAYTSTGEHVTWSCIARHYAQNW